MEQGDEASQLAANRANWDERVPIHLSSQFYDVDGWLANPRPPRAWEVASLGDVTGLDAVHLQCHFGLDTMALAVAGARSVVGVDFSGEAIAAARDLAARGGFADRARFVQSDVYEAAAALAAEQFDLVYVSLGALTWLPSATRWAEQVAALLRPGGRLYLHDGHPMASAMADGELTVTYPYFEEPGAIVTENDATYTDGEQRLQSTRNYEWNHSLGEIVNAVIENGLRIDRLDEHDWTVWRQFPWLERQPDGRWITPSGHPRIPLTFTLLASLPSGDDSPKPNGPPQR